MAKLDKKIEKLIKLEAEKELRKGKPDWDIPHTLSAVKWMKKLIKEKGCDEKILVPAMYLHDTGYPLLKNGYTFKESINAKKIHAKRGAEFAHKILNNIGSFSNKEIEKICYLIENHDKHNNIKDINRQLVFEADGLAQIDWKSCTPNFDKENAVKWIEKYFEIERQPKYWKTEFGKKQREILLKKAYAYLDKMK